MFEVDDIDKVEGCIKNLMKEYQYRKYKEVYEVNLDILKKACSECDLFVNGFKKVISKKQQKKKQLN